MEDFSQEVIERSKPQARNSNCSEGQMKTYKVTRGPHCDADAGRTIGQFSSGNFQKHVQLLGTTTR